MIGAYFALLSRRIDERPEDDPHGEIEQGAGDQGVYSPWSWWPLVLGVAAAIVFAGLAVGFWLSVHRRRARRHRAGRLGVRVLPRAARALTLHPEKAPAVPVGGLLASAALASARMRHSSAFAAAARSCSSPRSGAVLAGCAQQRLRRRLRRGALPPSDVTGEWAAAERREPLRLPRADRGRHRSAASDGCNRAQRHAGRSTARPSSSARFAATMMACDGVDTWLSGASSATVVRRRASTVAATTSGTGASATLEKTD